MKSKLDLDEGLPLNKRIQTHNVTIVVTAVFYKNNKHY